MSPRLTQPSSSERFYELADLGTGDRPPAAHDSGAGVDCFPLSARASRFRDD